MKTIFVSKSEIKIIPSGDSEAEVILLSMLEDDTGRVEVVKNRDGELIEVKIKFS